MPAEDKNVCGSLLVLDLRIWCCHVKRSNFYKTFHYHNGKKARYFQVRFYFFEKILKALETVLS